MKEAQRIRYVHWYAKEDTYRVDDRKRDGVDGKGSNMAPPLFIGTT